MDRKIEAEARLFSHYLIGEDPTGTEAALYGKALEQRAVAITAGDARLLGLARHKWLLGFIDAGAALVRPDSELRRRLHLMFAILEASPEHVRHFLSAEAGGVRSWPGAAATALQAGVKAVVGVPLVILLTRGS